MSMTKWSADLSDSHSFPTERVVHFCGYLRDNGIRTTPHDAVLLIEVLGFADTAYSAKRVEQLWRPIVCRSFKEWRHWPVLFNSYWFPHSVKGTVKVTGSTKQSMTLQQVVEKSKAVGEAPSAGPIKVGDNPEVSDQHSASETGQKAVGGASRIDPTDECFESSLMRLDLTILERLAQTVKSQLLRACTRRWNISNRGRFINLRKTTQSMLRLGGDGVIPAWQKRRYETPKIVLAVDVSRSMESFAEFYLRLASAFARWLPIRVYVFHVRCSEITDLLMKDDPKVQDEISNVTAGFQGGTKIASSIRQICFEAGGVTLNRRTRLWIFSDGYDTEDPDALRNVLKRVRGRGATIDWFYPNKNVNSMGYCIQLIKPLVKNWYGAANLKQLEQSLRHLK